MGRLLLVWAFIAAFALQAASAQALPDSLRSAGVTQAQWDAIRGEARRQAQRAQISEASLIAAAEAASINLAQSDHLNALGLQQAIFETLSEQADQIAELRRRLDAATGDADPAATGLLAQARAALDEGRLADADRLLAQAAARDLAALQQADAEVERRRLRAGETIAGRGQLAYVQADYLTAAEHLARAAATVPQSASEPRWLYTVWRANALYRRGDLFGEAAPLEDAIGAFESALVLRPRATAPSDWADTQNDLGAALRLQGERGAPAAFQRAIAAYEAALSVRTRAADPAGWAHTQMNLGNVFAVLGVRGAPGALQRAVTAYEAALTVLTRESDPNGWALTQMNLGIAHRQLGSFDRAVAAFRSALTVQTRESNPAGWANVLVNLGNTLSEAGERGANGALAPAAAAYEAALTVMTREADPAGWALTQMNLGIVLSVMGDRGVAGAYERAAAAYQASLSVRTRTSDPSGWALTQFNLAVTYQAMGRVREARTAAQGAWEEFERAGNTSAANHARGFLDRLPPE